MHTFISKYTSHIRKQAPKLPALERHKAPGLCPVRRSLHERLTQGKCNSILVLNSGEILEGGRQRNSPLMDGTCTRIGGGSEPRVLSAGFRAPWILRPFSCRSDSAWRVSPANRHIADTADHIHQWKAILHLLCKWESPLVLTGDKENWRPSSGFRNIGLLISLSDATDLFILGACTPALRNWISKSID